MQIKAQTSPVREKQTNKIPMPKLKDRNHLSKNNEHIGEREIWENAHVLDKENCK
jgi:hypothetical protein